MSTEIQPTYILQFCGVTNGNPGPAGAGAVLLAKDRTVLYRFHEELGHQTVNVAEFRALILGMKQAIKMGYKNIIAEGDSRLVINQFQGHWTISDEDIKALRDEAVELKASFQSFRTLHIPENYNSAAASEAKEAINLEEGSQVDEDSHDEDNSAAASQAKEAINLEEAQVVKDNQAVEDNQVEDDSHGEEDSLG